MNENPTKADLGEDAAEADFATLWEESIEVPEEGHLIHGVVIKILKDYVAVDINRKSEGMLPISDIPPEELEGLKAGDKVDVMVERYDGQQGFVQLSRTKVLKLRVWDDLQKAFDEGQPVEGVLVAKVKGGYTVDIGVRTFLPGSQVDLRPVKDTENVVGLKGKFKILKFSRKKANVVVSRRAWLEQEREGLRAGLLDHIKEGDVVEARVKNITDYGMFMDLGGLDGLMHITDMSYGKVTHPSELFKVGDALTVKVIRFDREKGRISLGLKQMKADPWGEIASRYPEGARCKGRVTNTTKYGAFIELEEGVEGLLHVSEMSWGKRLKDPSEVMKTGDVVDVVVLKVEIENRKISLGYRQLLANPWDELKALHPEGSVVDGVVKNLTDFGVFVDIGGEIDGLIHISDLSWNQRVKHPSEVVKKGDKITARVVKVDKDNQKFSLGLKQMSSDPWSELESRLKKGDTVVGKVTRVADFGVFVDVGGGFEGLVHISELSREKVESTASFCKEGDELTCTVLGLDRGAKKISLSVRAHQDEADRKSIESYMHAAKREPEGMTALAEAMRAAKQKLNGE
jgi:small subunit ribosomal protein S1